MPSPMIDTPPQKPWWRFLPLAILVLGLAAFFYFDGHHFLSLSTLQHYHAQIAAWAAAHFVLALVCAMLLYIVATAFSFPGASLITIAVGFIFGVWIGTTLVVFSATIGACCVFLAARTAFGQSLAAKAGASMKKLEAGFRENAFNYLLVLRLMPIFPFWLINIIPALLGVPLRTYALATFLGIIPGTFVYVLVGSGLSEVFASGQTLALGVILKPSIIGALVGMAGLSLLPVLYKKFKGQAHESIES